MSVKQIVAIKPDELEAIVWQTVNKALRLNGLIDQKAHKSINAELMSVSDAASFLNISGDILRKKARHGEVPFYKIGKSIYFKNEDLVTWVNSQKGGSHG